ncbi:MAG: glycosyltransferase [Cyanobacteria bacterium]|jgi:glycosyltransferase involved in cell wall biosynthesis|nr:glycosyltransferase [Cyanobacteria bacterium GSL.Bin21]
MQNDSQVNGSRESLKVKPLISIITVVKNGEANLEKTIQSVIRQTYENVEYIIVDGASKDRTIDIIRKYEGHIDYWVSEPDKGISDAFNKGIILSSGTWINFLNAGDCFLTPNVLQQVSLYFDQKHIVTGFSKYKAKTIPENILTNNDSINLKAKISQQASFVHREVFEKVGMFSNDYQIRMDYDFWLKALRKYEFKMLNEKLTDSDTNGVSSQGKLTKIFYQEEKKANLENNVKNSKLINLLLNWQYFKDRTKRFLLKK